MEQVFDGQKPTKRGTKKRPAVVRVQTEEREAEVSKIFEDHGWEYSVEVDPDEPEDVTDLDMLLNPIVQVTAPKKVGRNEPCPCGSGKKYKKCCAMA
jgi:SWIM/SEC-C metal-binding protein